MVTLGTVTKPAEPRTKCIYVDEMHRIGYPCWRELGASRQITWPTVVSTLFLSNDRRPFCTPTSLLVSCCPPRRYRPSLQRYSSARA
jgi:hypothetical protein